MKSLRASPIVASHSSCHSNVASVTIVNIAADQLWRDVLIDIQLSLPSITTKLAPSKRSASPNWMPQLTQQ